MKPKKDRQAEAIARREADLATYRRGATIESARNVKSPAQKAAIAERDILNTRVRMGAR